MLPLFVRLLMPSTIARQTCSFFQHSVTLANVFMELRVSVHTFYYFTVNYILLNEPVLPNFKDYLLETRL